MKFLTALALAATVSAALTPTARAGSDTAGAMKERLLAVVPLPFPPPARSASAAAPARANGAGAAATAMIPHAVLDPSCPSCPPRIEVPALLPFFK